MGRFKVCAAVALLVLVASCAYTHPSDTSEMSQLGASMYADGKPPAMDESRTIAKQDCTKPVSAYRGNVLCK